MRLHWHARVINMIVVQESAILIRIFEEICEYQYPWRAALRRHRHPRRFGPGCSVCYFSSADHSDAKFQEPHKSNLFHQEYNWENCGDHIWTIDASDEGGQILNHGN